MKADNKGSDVFHLTTDASHFTKRLFFFRRMIIWKKPNTIKFQKTRQQTLRYQELYSYFDVYTSHGSTWYTPDFHVVTIASQAFVPLGYQSLYPDVEDIGVKCLKLGGDCLLHVGICCKSLSSRMFLTGSKNLEITGPHTDNRRFDWLQNKVWEFMDHSP